MFRRPDVGSETQGLSTRLVLLRLERNTVCRVLLKRTERTGVGSDSVTVLGQEGDARGI